jgi:hypothetical protein
MRTKAMPPPPGVFSELILTGVKQLFLASFNGGAARTRVQRRKTSMTKITMAISRNTTDSIRRTKFAQEKTDDSQSADCEAARRRGVLKRWVVLVDHLLEFKSNAQSRAFDFAGEFDGLSSGEIVGTPDSVFLGNKKTAAATNPFLSCS